MSEEQTGLVSENAQEIKLDGSNTVTFPGYPYQFTALGEKILVSLDQYRSGYECPTCKGSSKVKIQDASGLTLSTACPDCKGKGVREGGLVIPDTSKVIASSGVVISMGAVARERCTEFAVGDRILFSVHAGSLIPTKAGLMFKQMDWYQAWVKVDGADELSAFDFVIAPEE